MWWCSDNLIMIISQGAHRLSELEKIKTSFLVSISTLWVDDNTPIFRQKQNFLLFENNAGFHFIWSNLHMGQVPMQLNFSTSFFYRKSYSVWKYDFCQSDHKIILFIYESWFLWDKNNRVKLVKLLFLTKSLYQIIK